MEKSSNFVFFKLATFEAQQNPTFFPPEKLAQGHRFHRILQEVDNLYGGCSKLLHPQQVQSPANRDPTAVPVIPIAGQFLSMLLFMRHLYTWNLTWRDCDKDMVTRRPLLKLGMSPIAVQSRSNRAPIADSVVCVRVLFYIDCLSSRHNQPCKAKISNRRYCWYSCGNTCGMWYHKRSNIPWMSAWPIAIQSPANRDAAFSNRAALIKHVPT